MNYGKAVATRRDSRKEARDKNIYELAYTAGGGFGRYRKHDNGIEANSSRGSDGKAFVYVKFNGVKVFEQHGNDITVAKMFDEDGKLCAWVGALEEAAEIATIQNNFAGCI